MLRKFLNFTEFCLCYLLLSSFSFFFFWLNRCTCYNVFHFSQIEENFNVFVKHEVIYVSAKARLLTVSLYLSKRIYFNRGSLIRLVFLLLAVVSNLRGSIFLRLCFLLHEFIFVLLVIWTLFYSVAAVLLLLCYSPGNVGIKTSSKLVWDESYYGLRRSYEVVK